MHRDLPIEEEVEGEVVRSRDLVQGKGKVDIGEEEWHRVEEHVEIGGVVVLAEAVELQAPVRVQYPGLKIC